MISMRVTPRLAEQAILGTVRAPRLIAWRDSHKGKRQTLIQDEASVGLQLTWDTKVRVDINDNEYSFIFTGTK